LSMDINMDTGSWASEIEGNNVYIWLNKWQLDPKILQNVHGLWLSE
jgi:hypothetical protein